MYKIWCRTCATEGINSVYVGETGNCCFQRGSQHQQDYRSTNCEIREKSVLRKHVNSVHDGKEEGVEFEMKITDVFKNDPLGRQVMEGVKICEMKVHNVMNSKDEFQQPGEIIPSLEGAGRRMNNNNNGNSYNNRNIQNSINSQNSVNSQNSDRGEEIPRGDSHGGDNNNRKVTTDCGTTGGVTTRSRARRENNVV